MSAKQMLIDTEQADQDLAMQWANETIPSWRNTYDLIRRVRAEQQARVDALADALEEFARLGEEFSDTLADDRPLYAYGSGYAITVGDIRRAISALRVAGRLS